jgi:hypothetical protein
MVVVGLYKFPTLIRAMSLSLSIFLLEDNRDIIVELKAWLRSQVFNMGNTR